MKQISKTLILTLLLGACTTYKEGAEITGEKPAGISPEELANVNKARGGCYKVGNPYQVNGSWYYPQEDFEYDEVGVASWYGPGFHAKVTANGDSYDMNALTAAHKTLPLPSVVRVTNIENGRSLVLQVNDRGPYVADRIIDVSRRAAQLLGFHLKGTTKVRVQILAEESKAIASEARKKCNQPEPLTAYQPDNTAIQVRDGKELEGEIIEGRHLPQGAPSRVPTAVSPVDEYTLPELEPLSNSSPAASSQAASSMAKGAPIAAPGEYVQVGAFSNYDNAQRLQQSLSRIGPAQVTEVSQGGRTLYHVRFGPYNEQAASSVVDKVLATGHSDVHIVDVPAAH